MAGGDWPARRDHGGELVIGWIALSFFVAAIIITAAVFAAGREESTVAEAAKAREDELKSQKETSDAKGRVLGAGAAAPRDHDALADHLRDGTF